MITPRFVPRSNPNHLSHWVPKEFNPNIKYSWDLMEDYPSSVQVHANLRRPIEEKLMGLKK